MFFYRRFSTYWWKEVLSYRTYTGQIKHRYQRAKYGISYRDSVNLDAHLNRVVAKGIDNLKLMANSYPESYGGIGGWHKKLDTIKLGMQVDPDWIYGDDMFDTTTRAQRAALVNGAHLMNKVSRQELIDTWEHLWD